MSMSWAAFVLVFNCCFVLWIARQQAHNIQQQRRTYLTYFAIRYLFTSTLASVVSGKKKASRRKKVKQFSRNKTL